MRILVCVKLVPDGAAPFLPDAEGVGLDNQGFVYRMNEYDVFAVEESVRWKEQHGDVEVTALTVGPGRSEAVVRRALEFGVDHGVHILTEEAENFTAQETAARIAAHAGQQEFSVLLFGVMSEDLQQYQTGPMTAALLGLPCTTSVMAASFLQGRQRLRVEREVEGGARDVLEMPLPAVLTVQPGINQPRYPSLSNKLRARTQELETVPSSPASQVGDTAERVRLFPPPPVPSGTVLEGTPEEKARQLLKQIHERTGLL